MSLSSPRTVASKHLEAATLLTSRRRQSCLRAVALLAMLALAGKSACAQNIAQDFPASLPGYETDLTLPMQQYDPRLQNGKGVRIGDFNLQPTLLETAGYDSNPLGNGAGGSSLLETNASLQINSDWRRDALDASFSVDDLEYFDRPLAALTNWTTGIGGSLDFLGSEWDLGYTHLAQHLGPQQLGTAGVTVPIPFSDDDIRFADDLVLGRVRLVPAFEYSTLSFGNAPGLARGDYSALDRQIYVPAVTGLFELSKGRSIVALVRDTDAEYRNAGFSSVGNVDDSYNDILGFIGVDFEANALIRLRALVGGESRNYRSASQSSTTTPAVEVDVIWQPTRLTQITSSFSRRLQDAASVYTGSATITDGKIQIDHALRHNIKLTASADVGTSDYASGALLGSNTRQMQQSYAATANWTMTRHAQLQLSYSYRRNDFANELVAALPGERSLIVSNVVMLGIQLSE